jgi:hypothetical protein
LSLATIQQELEGYIATQMTANLLGVKYTFETVPFETDPESKEDWLRFTIDPNISTKLEMGFNGGHDVTGLIFVNAFGQNKRNLYDKLDTVILFLRQKQIPGTSIFTEEASDFNTILDPAGLNVMMEINFRSQGG